jgi:hypothetical protein
MSEFVQSGFPEHEWLPWEFTYQKQSWSKSLSNQREYMNWLGKTLGYTKETDWYRLKREDFTQNKGSTLITRYRSVSHAVTTLFPEHDWKISLNRLPFILLL